MKTVLLLLLAAILAACGDVPVREFPVRLSYGMNVLDRPLQVGWVLPVGCRWVEGEKFPYGAVHCAPPTQSVGGYYSAPIFPYWGAPMMGGYGSAFFYSQRRY